MRYTCMVVLVGVQVVVVGSRSRSMRALRAGFKGFPIT